MSALHKLIVLGPTILLVLLTALAGAVYSRIDNLSLPISPILTLFTVVLPLVAGVSTHGTTTFSRRRRKNKVQQSTFSLPLLAVYAALLIYETVVGTLATTHIVPPSTLLCGLDERWTQLFRNKDANSIRAIQDTLSCCGFRTPVDRAWPFGFHQPSTCRETFNRSGSCLGPWRKAEQIYAGLLLLVSALVFVLTVFSLVSNAVDSSSSLPKWAFTDVSDEVDENSGRGEVRRMIEEGSNSATYRDEPAAESSRFIEASDDQQPRVEPSQLQEAHNEWRD